MKNFKYILGVVLILAVFVPLTTFGATIKVGDIYTHNEGDVIRDNFYIGAGEVASDGRVFGDLLIGAGNVSVSGVVTGDATIAGGDVSVLERVEGDLRILGGDILVTERVAGDLVVIGGNVRVLSSSNVGKDLVVLGGKVVVQGDVAGKVRIIGGEAILDSRVSGNVDVQASDGITIGDSAFIAGDLVYSGKDESVLTISDKAVVRGETTFKQGKVVSAKTFKTAMFAFFGTFLFIKLITILVAVALATIFLKKFSNRIARSAVEHIGKKTLWGFIASVVIPVATILLFASVFGIVLGALSMLGYVILLTLACIYSGVIFGAWMDKLVIRKQEAVTVDWKNGVLGVVALTLIMQIPVIGGLAGLFFFLLALGSISTLTYKHLWTGRK